MKRLVLILLLIITIPWTLAAQTQISGPQSGTLGPGTYIVTGNITVNAGQTLTIAPGTTFLHNGYWYWKIYGTLHAVGTVADSIRWLRQNPVPAHRWAGDSIPAGRTQWQHLQLLCIRIWL